MLFLRWFAICLFCLPLTLFAADKPVTKDELDHAKEVIQLKLDAAQNGLQKDSQAFFSRLESQDKRIEDIKSRIDIASLFLGAVGILITILAGFATFLGYVTVTRKAREEAQAEARKEAPIAAQATVEKWFKEHHQELENALTDFRSKSLNLLDEITWLANQTKLNMTEIKNGVQEAADQEMAAMKIGTSPSDSSPIIKADAPSALQQVAQSLEQKPESEYGFNEWNTRAFAAYENRDLEGAARYWRHAAGSGNATAIQEARSLLYVGVALGEQNRYEEAITTNSKLINRFQDAPDPALREQVATAKNGKGFDLLRLAKQNWQEAASRQQWLQEAQLLFIQALEHFSDKGMVMGNQAYCAHLLGQTEQVRELLRQALTAGGERIYQAELNDLAIHPVPPDAEFRKLLAEIWAEVQQSQ